MWYVRENAIVRVEICVVRDTRGILIKQSPFYISRLKLVLNVACLKPNGAVVFVHSFSFHTNRH